MTNKSNMINNINMSNKLIKYSRLTHAPSRFLAVFIPAHIHTLIAPKCPIRELIGQKIQRFFRRLGEERGLSG